ncbi:hypothetical protein BHM03_00020221 [Ensete ventricosum]|nr:hypothetical protein BHM03_00020221 [Ensete ventricosum]
MARKGHRCEATNSRVMGLQCHGTADILNMIVPTLEEGASADKIARYVKLAKGEMDLKIGNRARVAAIAFGEVTLHLPNGATIALDVIRSRGEGRGSDEPHGVAWGPLSTTMENNDGDAVRELDINILATTSATNNNGSRLA